MILAITMRGSRTRPRSRKPDVLGFGAELQEGRVSVPLLVVNRHSRARSARAHLISPDGAKERLTVAWPALAVGAYESVTLEVQS